MPAPRRGIVLLAVMIVITILSLLAYQYADLTSSELRASYNAIRAAQARAAAKSGVHKIAALLASPDTISTLYGNNLWDNELMFRNVPIPNIEGATYSLLAPPEPGSGATSNRFGLLDEGGKLNLNAFMLLDITGGELLAGALMGLPGMTQDVANSIVDYLDPDSEARQSSAENEHYSPLKYRAKNGPIDSIEELLLVQGVTQELLYGADKNRNGILDADEDSSGDLGWQQYLTVLSREQLVNDQGQVLQNISVSMQTQISSGLYQGATLYDMITITVSEEMATYLALYAQYGGKAMTADTKAGGKGTKEGNLADVPRDKLNMKKSNSKLKSLFSLVNSYVQVDEKQQDGTTSSTIYICPLADPAQQRDLLPKLFQNFTTVKPQTYWPASATNQEIPARINVNTAPQAVLQMMQGWLGAGGSQVSSSLRIADADITNIIALRPDLSSVSPDPIFQTPAWLLTEAKMSADLLQGIESFITTSSQVYRVHVVGTVGPISARVEAVIDVNAGRPRIIYYRDLSESGPANLQ